MNYFAHAIHFLDQPYFLAGTAVPDWLSVSDRGVRLRAKQAWPLLDDPDPCVAALAAGVVQHLADDAQLHDTRAFAEVSLGLAGRARELLGGEPGFRPAVLGHLLVEVLLDAALIAQQPARLEAYYRALEQVDAAQVQRAVNRVASRPAERLAAMIREFRRRRILSDYLEDGKLLVRLNQVMRRVGFGELPEAFLDLLPETRQWVCSRQSELLAGTPTPFRSELISQGDR